MPDRAPVFVYVVYIAARAEKVWNALIDRELTKAYWEHFNVSTGSAALGGSTCAPTNRARSTSSAR